jgi:6-phosphogluconolactonase
VPSEPPVSRRVWVGGYTPEMDGDAGGIALLTVDAGGVVQYRGTATSTMSPSFLALADGVIYATGESGPAVSAFARSGDALTPLGESSAGGEFPCALTVADGLVIVASYGDGAVAVHRIGESGAIGAAEQVLHSTGDKGGPQGSHGGAQATERGPHPAQDGPHAHAALVVRRNAQPPIVLTTDLGTDRVFVHTLHPERRGSALARTGDIHLNPGTGPATLCCARPATCGCWAN